VRDWLDHMYAQGQVTFTLAEASRLRNASPNSTRLALSRAQRDSVLFSPMRGFYVIVPPEYRSDGAPPWRWFVAPMLGYLDAPYYVGLLTAAAQHGASPQAAQEAQVIVDRQIRQKIAGRQRVEFILRRRASQAPIVEVTTPTGRLRVSTPEMTMLDLVAYPSRAAGWGNIASLLPDLTALASRRGWKDALQVEPRATEVQRLGHLLDRFGAAHTDILEAWLAGRPFEPTPLVPGGAAVGRRDPRWRVIVNALVEPD
jgi:predicted transcriptional regulator of viral defense system